MITAALDTLGALLARELFDGADRVRLGPFASPPADLPCAALWPGALAWGGAERPPAGPRGGETVREFTQQAALDLYAAQPADAERLASLAAGLIAIAAPELIDHFNARQPTGYQAKTIRSAHVLDQIRLLGAEPALAETRSHWRLLLAFGGQARFSPLTPASADLIKTILLEIDEAAGA